MKPTLVTQRESTGPLSLTLLSLIIQIVRSISGSLPTDEKAKFPIGLSIRLESTLHQLDAGRVGQIGSRFVGS